MMGDPSQNIPEAFSTTPLAAGEAYANLVAAEIREAKKKPPIDWLTASDAFTIPPYDFDRSLSTKERKSIENMMKMQVRIIESGIKSRCTDAQRMAAAAIAVEAEPPLEPVSGRPFVFDPKSWTVSIPEDDSLPQVQPLAVVKFGLPKEIK